MIRIIFAVFISALMIGQSMAIGLGSILDIKEYKCVSGSCGNGDGTLRHVQTGVEYTGPWRDKSSIPGVKYEVRHAGFPGKTFYMTFADDGLPQEGDQIYGSSFTSKGASVFSGTFGRATKTMIGGYTRPYVMAVPRTGVYDTGFGLRYRGDFSWVPAPSYSRDMQSWSNVYIFVGTLIDDELQEESQGLFVSEKTHDGFPFRLIPARPDYIAKLQEEHQAGVQRDQGIIAKRKAEDAAFLGFIGNVVGAALTIGTAGIGSDDNRRALDLIGALVTGGQNKSAGEVDGNSVTGVLLNAALSGQSGGDNAKLQLGLTVANAALSAGRASASAPAATGSQYQTASFEYSCDRVTTRRVDIPYKSASCLEARKSLITAASCNQIDKLAQAYRTCEQSCARRTADCAE